MYMNNRFFNKTFIILLLAALATSPVVTSFASELQETEQEQNFEISKDTVFEITDNYEGCAFTITTEKIGNFAVSMYNTNDTRNVYSAVIEDSDSCTINVQDVKKGTWRVEVTTSSETETTAEEVIGKIKVAAKAIDKTAFSVDNVSVARDIVGLCVYTKDNNVVVEWSDQCVGNVIVTVTDNNNAQIIDKQTVQGTYYEHEIPTLTKEITVNVVPSKSASVKGANSQYNVKMDYDPDVNVSYEDREYTNLASIMVHVCLNDTYSLIMECNDNVTEQTEKLQTGEYDFEIPLNEGLNKVKTYIVDSDHNMKSFTYEITRDSIQPALSLETEYDGISTYDDTITIKGSIKDYVSFNINEVEPVVAGDGQFEVDYLLHDGQNVIEVKACDIAGNESIYTATVTKLIKEKMTVVDYIRKFGIPLCVLIFGIIALTWKRKKDVKSDVGSTPKKPKKEQKTNVVKEEAHKKFSLTSVQKDVIEFVILCIVLYIVFSKIILWGSIPSSSMEPTLKKGDIAITNGVAYLKNEPSRGDVVVFDWYEGEKPMLLIKRVIGLPGDHIEFIDGFIYINDQLCYEDYIDSSIETNCTKQFDVPDGCYFLLGDNRENSYDARYWENPYISINDIKGKLITDIPVSSLKRTLNNLFD